MIEAHDFTWEILKGGIVVGTITLHEIGFSYSVHDVALGRLLARISEVGVLTEMPSYEGSGVRDLEEMLIPNRTECLVFAKVLNDAGYDGRIIKQK